MTVLRIAPNQYVHILSKTTNVTRLVKGPCSLVLQQDEEVARPVTDFTVVPENQYCVVRNPVKEVHADGSATLRIGHEETRFHGEPFPLYPGESLGASGWPEQRNGLSPLPEVPLHYALRLQALDDYTEPSTGAAHPAGQMWQLEGPLLYRPSTKCRIVSLVEPIFIRENHAVRLRALVDCVDGTGKARATGEEWIVRPTGAPAVYLPQVTEEVACVIEPVVLTDTTAIHVRALQTHTDDSGTTRRAGEEWLVTAATNPEGSVWLPSVGQAMARAVSLVVLGKSQFAVVHDPTATKEPDERTGTPAGTPPGGPAGTPSTQWGERELRTGPATFFLHPGETLEGGVRDAFVLEEDEALLVTAQDAFVDGRGGKQVQRKAGDTWMVHGRCSYTPPIEASVVETRKAICLSQNEGVYIQNRRTGELRAVMGPCTYMPVVEEVPWKKPVRPIVQRLLANGGAVGAEGTIRKLAYFESYSDPTLSAAHDATRVVTYRCPHNAAVRVLDHKKKTSRVVFGPNLVALAPHEDFDTLSLSAGKPKKENALVCIPLLLGPDFITDEIEVETADHARLSVRYAVNNHFDVDVEDEAAAERMFSVPDFIGFACRQLASSIRAAVARVSFDQFHKNSARLIRAAVLGVDADGKIRDSVRFPENGLTLTNIDIQRIDPVEAKMNDLLAKSVFQAIEIAIASTEATAGHNAERVEQESRGRLERAGLQDFQLQEKARMALFRTRAENAAIESTGQTKAEAQAQADRRLIEAHGEITAATLKGKASRIENAAELAALKAARRLELAYRRELNDLEVDRARRLARMEVEQFTEMVMSLGAETIAEMARAGPEMQARLLQGLGIKSTLITDGKAPINLFGVANGLTAGPSAKVETPLAG